MEFRYLPLFFSLNVILIMSAAESVLPPEVYWERMLPNTPMPKAIIDILNLGSKEIQSQEPSPFTYGTEKSLSQDEFPLFYNYNTKKIQAEDQLLYNYGIKRTPSRDKFIFYGDKDSQPHNAKALLPNMISVANHHDHDHPKANLIFFEEGLRPGMQLDSHFPKRKYVTPLLPRQIAERVPFSSEKIKEILEIFYMKPESENVEIVEKAINRCEAPAITGEEKHCATSVESMVDFITSKLGKSVSVISTEVEKETTSQKFLVKDGMKMIAEDKNIITCHPMHYPHLVFFCHQLLNTTSYFMPLEGEDGTRVKAVALCHKDTSEWDPEHIAFKMLKVKPGTIPVCHILPEGHLLWFAK